MSTYRDATQKGMGIMRNSRLVALGAWLLVIGVATAQQPAAKGPQPKELPPLAPTPVAAEPAPVAVPIEVSSDYPSEIVWFRTDFLTWGLPASRLKTPIVTTGDPNDPCAGNISLPSTRVLFGSQDFKNDHATGIRFVFGTWLDSAHDFGVEVNGFTMFRENHAFQIASDNNGNAPIYLPAYNLQCTREDAAAIADPLAFFGGSVRANIDMKLYGGELNGLLNVQRAEGFEWSLLGGVRFLELRESFNLNAVSRDLVLNQQISIADHFETTNDFLGGQLGTRLRWRHRRFLFDLAGKLALGGVQRSRVIFGQSNSIGPDATNPGTFPGGFYAQPSNIGRTSDVTFAVMPALELKLGFQIASGIVASVGYDLFYLNQSIRVANQIDRNLNLSQSAVLGTATPIAPIAPRQINDSSDLLVQGLSFGLEIRY